MTTTADTGKGAADSPELTARTRRTTVASQSAIEDVVLHPGTVRINVQGAFIVDDEQPSTPRTEDYEHDPRDIRLPNHTTVVSHVAVDVSLRKLFLVPCVAARDSCNYHAYASGFNHTHTALKAVLMTMLVDRSEAPSPK